MSDHNMEFNEGGDNEDVSHDDPVNESYGERDGVASDNDGDSDIDDDKLTAPAESPAGSDAGEAPASRDDGVLLSQALGGAIKVSLLSDGNFALDVNFGASVVSDEGVTDVRTSSRVVFDREGNTIEPGDPAPAESSFLDYRQPFDETYQGVSETERKAAGKLFSDAHGVITSELEETRNVWGIEVATARTSDATISTTTLSSNEGPFGDLWGKKRLYVGEPGAAGAGKFAEYNLDSDGTVRRFDAQGPNDDTFRKDLVRRVRLEAARTQGEEVYARVRGVVAAERALETDRDYAAMMGVNNLPVGLEEIRAALGVVGEKLGIADKLQPLIDSAEYSDEPAAVNPELQSDVVLTTGWVRESASTVALPLRPLESYDARITGTDVVSSKIFEVPDIQTRACERLKEKFFADWPEFVDTFAKPSGQTYRSMHMESVGPGLISPLNVFEEPRLNNTAAIGMRLRDEDGQPQERFYYSGAHRPAKGIRTLQERNGVSARFPVSAETAAGLLNVAQHARPRTTSFNELNAVIRRGEAYKLESAPGDDDLIAAGQDLRAFVSGFLRREAAGDGSEPVSLETTVVDPDGSRMHVSAGERFNAEGEREPFVTVSATRPLPDSYLQEHYPYIDKGTRAESFTSYEFSLDAGRVRIRLADSQVVGGEAHSYEPRIGYALRSEVRLLRNFLARPLIRGVQRVKLA